MLEKENDGKNISEFSLKCVSIMTHMLATDTVSDDVLDTLRDLELTYYSLVDKITALEEKINIDTKTNLLKYNDDYLTRIIKTASRVLDGNSKTDSSFNISYVRFDLDDFSVINNTYGHDNGDTVLIDFSNILKESIRPTDYPIRFGGEEFDLILQATDSNGATKVVNKIYSKVSEKLRYRFEGKDVSVSASAGISELSIPNKDLKKILNTSLKDSYAILQKHADDALYLAKYEGKKTFRVYDKNIDYQKIRKEYAESKKS